MYARKMGHIMTYDERVQSGYVHKKKSQQREGRPTMNERKNGVRIASLVVQD